MRQTLTDSSIANFAFWAGIAVILSSCSTPLRVDQEILERGIFVINSRDVRSSAMEPATEGGEPTPKSLVAFGDLESKPQLRFRGVLEPSKPGQGAGSSSKITNHIRTLDFDAFHGQTPTPGGSNSFRQSIEKTKSLVIYVHGFNNSPRDAAEQAVEIQEAMDQLDHDATLMFYTWPTSSSFYQVVVGGALRKATFGHVDSVVNDIYLNDRKNVDIASHALYALYQELDTLYPNLNIDLIAHSMGSEVVMKSFLLWHYHRMIENRRSAEEIQIIRRLVLVGADIGIDLFKVLAAPSSMATEEILVYLNPRDGVLEESSKLNDDQARVGSSPLDTPLPGISPKFTFVELTDRLLPKGSNPIKQFLVNHNPLSDERILHHACRFVATGRIVEETPSLHVHEQTGGNFRGSAAGYYRVHFGPDEFLEAVQGVPGAVLGSTNAAVGAVRQSTGAAVGAVANRWPKRLRIPKKEPAGDHDGHEQDHEAE